MVATFLDHAPFDPGPDMPQHITALLKAVGNETVTHILVTHTHLDHSPAAAALKRATGSRTYGFGPHGSGRAEDRAKNFGGIELGVVEEGGDHDFTPDVTMREGDGVTGPGWNLTAVETPGHTSNHLCFYLAEQKTLFTGDHVMGWSTSVIVPPDGDMAAYMRSLRKLMKRDDTLYWPTHGPSIPEPKKHVAAFITHRQERTVAILAGIRAGASTIPEIVTRVYAGLDPRLIPAAGRSVLAHLIDLVERGLVLADGPPGPSSIFRLKP